MPTVTGEVWSPLETCIMNKVIPVFVNGFCFYIEDVQFMVVCPSVNVSTTLVVANFIVK